MPRPVSTPATEFTQNLHTILAAYCDHEPLASRNYS